MFAELMPVISNRPLTITIAPLAEGKIRVCVVPQSQDKDGKVNSKVGHQAEKEVAKIPESAVRALTTPLVLTGTPQELDMELSEKLTTYAEAHTRLQHGIDQATREISDALKAIEERDKSKPKSKPAVRANQAKDESKQEESTSNSGTLPLAWCVPSAETATPVAALTDDSAGSANKDAKE